jgi:energy-converting hydrogenase B subunit D
MLYVMIFLSLLIISAAVYALYTKQVVSAIIASGAVSLVASLAYIILGAPDVAMTEAAIGSGLTTLVFLLAWSKIREALREQGKDNEKDLEEVHND